MAPDLARVRVRLLQVRTNPAVLAEERRSFAARCGVDVGAFAITNVLRDPISEALLDDVDAVMIGGAGAYSVTETYAWTDALIALCRTGAERRLPLFGSCWGHQFIGRAFGGTVIHDLQRAEMGTCTVSLTDAGRRDPLFSSLPGTFRTQMGHQDRVSVLPEGAVELAASARCPHQAFRLGELPIYGTQFHSELDAPTVRQRLVAYRAHYPEMADDGVFQQTLDAVESSPEADDLLRRFLLLYAVEGGAAVETA